MFEDQQLEREELGRSEREQGRSQDHSEGAGAGQIDPEVKLSGGATISWIQSTNATGSKKLTVIEK